MKLDEEQFTCEHIGSNQVILMVTDKALNTQTCTLSVSVQGTAQLENNNPELCNGRDDNCNGLIDEGWDQDGDGYTSCSGDCDDSDKAIYPGSVEICNGKDDNCDAKTDEGYDLDGDGYTSCGGDCKDNNKEINPGAAEMCNGKDDNCDGQVDEGLSGMTYEKSKSFLDSFQVKAWLPCFSVIQGDLIISGFDINDLSPLRNITKVTGNVTITLTALKNLKGLENLKEIGGHLLIHQNGRLISLEGLQNLSSVGGRFSLYYNRNLSNCCPVYGLLNSGGVRGTINIFGNRTTCENMAAIVSFCGGIAARYQTDPVPANISVQSIGLYPNPVSNRLFVHISRKFETGSITIFDVNGKRLIERELTGETWDYQVDVTSLNPGMYMSKTIIDDIIYVDKFVVERR
jgi:hypothetical protein